MNKEEIIKKYGEAAYEKMQQQGRGWYRNHLKEAKERARLWNSNHPDIIKAKHREQSRKGGKYYEQKRKYFSAGLPREKDQVRQRHCYYYRKYKQIIAPNSQIHHEWIPNTSKYRGVALVEKEQHQYGFIDVIQILEGKITLLTEAEIRMDGAK